MNLRLPECIIFPGKCLALLLVVIFCCGVVSLVKAQAPAGNLRKKIISTRQAIITLDSLSIVPNSVHIPAMNDSCFKVDVINASLTWNCPWPVDSVMVVYRVFGARLNAVASRTNYDTVLSNYLNKPYRFIDERANKKEDNFFNFGNIRYNGSFGRGISFGNSQDAVVTSVLNLQLSGYIADSIQITAAITDNNIPIQPDGTTQQLNEFDRVYLEFKKKDWKLGLGDIDLRQGQNYFLKFYKRLQGGTFETVNKITPGITNSLIVNGSIAKGKYNRNVFQGLEGNQGPYRLQGANNELYFVVLGGTEKIYVDGVLMQRGEDQDYIIDYNTAEITFTAKRMITKDKRIQVEFEYADRNYLNTNFYLADEANINKKVRVRVAAYANTDSKNSPINQTLNDDEKKFLNIIGDSINKAFYPNATIDTFAAGKILYKKIDTLYNSIHDSIYVYSTNPDSARYNLSFINVGQGNGNYIPDLNGANGKVYKWVQPIGGVKQGYYEAAVFLVTPKKQNVVTAGVDYNISKNTTISADGAYSENDVNTLSQKDKENDKGYATKLLLRNLHDFKGTKNNLNLLTNAGFEWVDARFKPVERLRGVEYLRDWGLPLTLPAADEKFLNASVELRDKKGMNIRYELNTYTRDNNFRGVRNILTQIQEIKGFRLNNSLNLSNTQSDTTKGYFFRPSFDVSKMLKKLKNYTIGASFALEHNEVRNIITDTLSSTSFSFQTIQAYLKSDESKYNKWGLTYMNRTDRYPLGKELVRADVSNNVNLYTELLKNPKDQLRLNVTYRNLQVLRPGFTSDKSEESLLGRVEYMVNEWKGLLAGSVLYELGSGQEQRRDYAYLEVPAGQGQYTWIDYNNDGVQQLNEFEVALFPDQAKYIRIFTPTNDYIKANYNTFNYSFTLNPRSVINEYKATGIKKMIARFNLQSSLQISKKEIAAGLAQFNPFSKEINDTSLISLTSIWSNTLSYNRFNTKWGMDLTNVRSKTKALLTYGLESRQANNWNLKWRWAISRSITFNTIFGNGFVKLNTANQKLDNTDYNVQQYSVEPSLTFIKGTNLRLTGGYKFNNKNNKLGEEKMTAHSLNTEAKYNLLQSMSLTGKFTFSDIKYPTAANTSVSYIMLDGLLPGKNYLWSIDVTKRLANNLELSMNYEGRQPGQGRTVHLGRASLRAIL